MTDTSKGLTKSQLGWTTFGLDAASTLLKGWNAVKQGELQANEAKFRAEASGIMQVTQLYNQSVPLFQQIGSQVRELMNYQAMQYMGAGVDITQGTAAYVLQHTKEQGDLKMDEIRYNINMQAENIEKAAKYQATAEASAAILNGYNNMVNVYGNFVNKYEKSVMNLYANKK